MMTDKHYWTSNTVTIGCGLTETKSSITIGNLIIMNNKCFNWFQKKMWKIFFGADVKNIKENNNENTKN